MSEPNPSFDITALAISTAWYDMVSDPKHLYCYIRDVDLQHIEILMKKLFGEPWAVPSVLTNEMNAADKLIDLKGISFVHLMETVPQSYAAAIKRHQATLRCLGAIFTLEEFEQDFNAYLETKSELEERSRYLEQMVQDLNTILNGWKSGALRSSSIMKQLDQEAMLKLRSLLWPNGAESLMKECKDKSLAEYANQKLVTQKESEFNHWIEGEQNKLLEPHVEKELESVLAQELWKKWTVEPNNNSLEHLPFDSTQWHLIIKQLEHYRDEIIYRMIKSDKFTVEINHTIIEIIKDQLDQMVRKPNDKLDDTQKMLVKKFNNYKAKLIHDSGESLAVIYDETERAKKYQNIHEEAMKTILKEWQHSDESGKNGFKPEEEQIFKYIIKNIPRDKILEGELFTNITQQAVIELIQVCRRNPKDLNAHTLKLCLQGIIVHHPRATDIQKGIICEQILSEWKKTLLPNKLQTELESIIFQKWNKYREQALQNNPKLDCSKQKCDEPAQKMGELLKTLRALKHENIEFDEQIKYLKDTVQLLSSKILVFSKESQGQSLTVNSNQDEKGISELIRASKQLTE